VESGGADQKVRSPSAGDQTGETDEKSIWSCRSDRT